MTSVICSTSRAELHERVTVEHGLARIHPTPGDCAGDLGARNNLDDLRRHAAIADLDVEIRRAV